MDHETQIDRISKQSLYSAAIVVVFFILLGSLSENGWWGINHLYFYPDNAWIFISLFIILAILLYVPKPKLVRNCFDRASSTLSPIAPYLRLIIMTALFILGRAAVHSLGDGYQRASEIESGFVFKSTEMLDFLIHAVLYKLSQYVGTFDATEVMAATSIAAGMVFIYVLWQPTLFSDWRKSAFAWAVFSLGSSQLFFGYVESYTLVYLFGIWYMLLAFRAEGSEAGILSLTVIYLLASFSHVIGLILLPSYMLLVYRRLGSRSGRSLLLALFFLISLTPLIIPQALARFAIADDVKQMSDYFLPIFGGGYSVFSLRHLFDILNQFLLVAPILFMLVPFSGMAFRLKRYRPLALSIVVPAFGFILLIDPELSMIRDWDLFALPVALCVVPFLILIFKSIQGNHPVAKSRFFVALILSVFMMCMWVMLNSNRTRHLQRAEYVLEHSVKGQKYGYELLAYYYSTHQDHENELRILQNINPIDRTAPVYGKISQALYLLERYDEAYNYAQQGARMPRPDLLNAIMAGITAYDQGEFPEAAYYFRIASDLSPNDPQWLCKLGNAYTMIDSLDEALSAFSRAMTQNSDMACSFFGVAELHYRKSEFEQAGRYCQEGLRRDPNSAIGQELLKKIRNQR